MYRSPSYSKIVRFHAFQVSTRKGRMADPKPSRYIIINSL